MLSSNLPKGSHRRVFTRAIELINEHPSEALTVQDLSEAVHVSERTLRRLFERESGMSPKKYLLSHRLHGVHRQLRQSSPSEHRVSDVANAWGFWHMGQFAKNYRFFFGELPSVTLKKQPGSCD